MWIKVAKFSDISPEKPQVVELNGKQIALFNVRGKIYAINNLCPHQGGPLAEGYVDGFEVTCPWHAWGFDVRNGNCAMAPAAKQRTYKTKKENGEIFVDLDNSK